MIIDAKDLIVGRLSSFAAKKALQGESIHIVNAEQAVVTGKKKDIITHYKHKSERGQPITGPFIPKQEEKFLKRIIRGMLPYKRERGRVAFRKIKCYQGTPESLKDKKTETIKTAHISRDL